MSHAIGFALYYEDVAPHPFKKSWKIDPEMAKLLRHLRRTMS